MALSNFDIMDICKQLNLNCNGVYSKDRLPSERRVGSYYINLEDADDGNGTHWVMCMIFPEKEAIYFDSFGVLPPIEVKDFLKPFRPYATSNRHIQDNPSNKCGYFCIGCDQFFTYDRRPKKSIAENFDDYLNMFSINKTINDKIIMEYLNK